MQAIDEQTVDSTWQEVAGYGQDEAAQKMELLSQAQPSLLALIAARTEDLDQEARELTIYMFFLVYAIFRRAFGKEIPLVSLDAIMTEQQETHQLIENIESLPEESWDASVLDEPMRQPFVMRHIMDAITETDESADVDELTEDERAMIFLTMRSVVTLLDEATEE